MPSKIYEFISHHNIGKLYKYIVFALALFFYLGSVPGIGIQVHLKVWHLLTNITTAPQP